MIECTKGLWTEHMDGDGIAPELRMGALEEEMHQQEQHGNSALAAQQAKEAHDEMESWLQVTFWSCALVFCFAPMVYAGGKAAGVASVGRLWLTEGFCICLL